MTKTCQLVAACALALVGHAANATWINGDTVAYQYIFPNSGSNYSNASNGNHVVGAGIEIANIADATGTINLSDGNLLADFSRSATWSGAAFNGFRITDVFGAIADFTSVTINPLTNMTGFDVSRITFDANSIWVNWQGLRFDANTFVSLDIGGRDVNVPEPSIFGLFALGLMGLGVGANRRRRIAAV